MTTAKPLTNTSAGTGAGFVPWVSLIWKDINLPLTAAHGPCHPPGICYAMSTAILPLRVIGMGIKPTCWGPPLG